MPKSHLVFFQINGFSTACKLKSFLFWSELLSRCQWNLCTQYITQFPPCFPFRCSIFTSITAWMRSPRWDICFRTTLLSKTNRQRWESVWWLCSEFIFLLFFMFSSGFVIVVFCSCLSIRMLCQCTGLKTS